MIKVFDSLKVGNEFEPALLSEKVVYMGASIMMTASVWLDLKADKTACEDVNLLLAVSWHSNCLIECSFNCEIWF